MLPAPIDCFCFNSVLDVNVADLPDGVKTELKALAYDLAGALVFDYGMYGNMCADFIFLFDMLDYVSISSYQATESFLISILFISQQIWMSARRYLRWARRRLSSAIIFW